MKLLIMQADGRDAYGVANGEFIKIQNKGYQIGDLVDYKPNAGSNPIRNLLATAASFLILISAAAVGYSYPVTHIDVDINPSIEISANVFDRVVSIRGNNPDGIELVHDVNAVNQNLDKALEQILQMAENAGYIAAEYEDNGVCISIYNNSEKRAGRLEETAKLVLGKRTDLFDIKEDLILEKGTGDSLKAARLEGVSLAKSHLIENAAASAPEVTKEMLKDKPIFILKKITESNLTPETKAKIVEIVKENRGKINRNQLEETFVKPNEATQKQEELKKTDPPLRQSPAVSPAAKNTNPSVTPRSKEETKQNIKEDFKEKAKDRANNTSNTEGVDSVQTSGPAKKTDLSSAPNSDKEEIRSNNESEKTPQRRQIVKEKLRQRQNEGAIDKSDE